MSSKSNHNLEPQGVPFVDEKSMHDRFLSLLSVIVLLGLVILGVYWQSLPLPEVAEQSTKH